MQTTSNATVTTCAAAICQQTGVTADYDSVILAGAIGPDGAGLFTRFRPSLPLVRSTLMDNIIKLLFDGGAQSCTICSNNTLPTHFSSKPQSPNAQAVTFCIDPIPRGTAGCVKDAERNFSTDCVLVIGGAVWLEDSPAELVRKHRASGNSITVVCSRTVSRVNGSRWYQSAGIFIMERSVLEIIPKSGFFDIKEQLIPAAQRAGLSIGAIEIENDTHEVANWSCYVRAVEKNLETVGESDNRMKELAPGIWCGEDVTISQSARIVGPVLIGHRCVVSDNALIMGPAVLADDTHVGESACLIRVVMTDALTLPPGTHMADQLIAKPSNGKHVEPASDGFRSYQSELTQEQSLNTEPQTPGNLQSRKRFQFVSAALIVCAAFVAAFWNTITELMHTYEVNSEASAGALVPFAALYMVATQRGEWPKILRSISLGGIALFGLGLTFNLLGTYYLYSSVANVGMVTSAVGLILGLVGWQGFKRIWYPVLFLYFMCPPPNRLLEAVMLPLQGLGAALSGFVLEIVGIASDRSGHVLEIAGHSVAVADACSGLRMVTSSIVVAGVLAFVVRAARWQRILLLLSSLPIALACNVVRITVTAALIAAGHQALAEGVFHSLTGMLMMPFMMVLLVLELKVFRLLAGSEMMDTESTPMAGMFCPVRS